MAVTTVTGDLYKKIDGKLTEIIEKFADHKKLSVVFQNAPSRTDLEQIGEIEEYDLPRVVLKVPRDEVSQRAVRLLTQFSVADYLVIPKRSVLDTPHSALLADLASMKFLTKSS